MRSRSVAAWIELQSRRTIGHAAIASPLRAGSCGCLNQHCHLALDLRVQVGLK